MRLGIAAATAAVALLAWPQSARPSDRNCTDQERVAADKWLFLNARDRKSSLEKHLPWGPPNPANDRPHETLLVHWDYVIQYDTNLRVPIWTAYRLDAKGLNKTPDRINCFRQDPRVNSPDASLPSDYDEPQFDQGHLAPSEDMSRNVSQNVNSFIMTNMAPQYGNFNRVIWKRLETHGRTWAKSRKTIYVISGSLFDHNSDHRPDAARDSMRMKARNGSRRVAIPSHFYKILAFKCRDGTLETLAFVLPHDKASHSGPEGQKYLEGRRVSIAEIEAMARVEFFPKVSAAGEFDKRRTQEYWSSKPSCS